MIQLNETWARHMVSLPEAGMDYQIVDITLKDGRTFEHIVVISAELVFAGDDFSNDDIADMKMSS